MMYFSEERCVMCGEIIPEGAWYVCAANVLLQNNPKHRIAGQESTAPEGSAFSWLTINRR